MRFLRRPVRRLSAVLPAALATCLILHFGSVLPAQPSAPRPAPTTAELQPAAAAFAQGDWKQALDAYTALSRKYPTHALSRFRMGVALVELRRYPEGEAMLREGERLGIPAPNVRFRLAESFAEQHKSDEAIAELLRAAVPGSPIGVATIVGDPHFASLTTHPRWPSLLDVFDAIVRPCLHEPRARDFDFWIGDWDVRPVGSPPAGPPARNTVTLENNGCTLVEHWVAPGGSEGQSFNLYDASLGIWRQTWVDNTGGQHDYRGGLVGRDMTFEGETPAPGGARGRIPTKLTFFHISDDSVRQFSQVSSDSGKTWSTAYDLMYVRRKGAEGLHPTTVPISDADRAAILALDSAYVAGWQAGDTARVLGVFAPDAILLPPGAAPVSGRDAIRRYWWPNDGSRTKITSFRREVVELSGTGGLAYLHATAALDWTYARSGERPSSQSTRSSEIVVYTQDSDGNWRVARQMWNARP